VATAHGAAQGRASPLDRSNPNALKDELIRHLKEDRQMSSFDFGVQLLDIGKMTYWDKPWGRQLLDRERERRLGRNGGAFPHGGAAYAAAGFGASPDAADAIYIDVTGNSTPDSTPLGSINRARWPGEAASRKARMARGVITPL
jgi:hypothetical protein